MFENNTIIGRHFLKQLDSFEPFCGINFELTCGINVETESLTCNKYLEEVGHVCNKINCHFFALLMNFVFS